MPKFTYNVAVPELKDLGDQLVKVEGTIDRITGAINKQKEAKKEYGELRQLLIQAEQAAKGLRTEIRKGADANREFKKAIDPKSLVGLTADITKLTKAYSLLSKEQRKGAEGKKILRSLKDVSKEARKAERALNKAKGAVSGLSASFKTFGRVLGAAGIILSFRALSTLMINITKDFAGFTRQMSLLREVSGATNIELIKLEDNARRLGERTDFTATQVANLQVAFARLGFTSEEILAATAAALDVATISGEDLGKTAEVLASTIRAFNLDASEAVQVANIMAKSFSSSALNLEKFKVSMAIAGPVAQSFGFSLERTTAIIGKMVDRSIDASTVGTSLRNIFISLQKDGISYNDALDRIQNSTNKAATAFGLFGKRGLTVALILSNLQEETAEFSRELINSTRFATIAANRIRNDLQGSIDKFNSALEGLSLNIVQKYAPALQEVIDLATKLLTIFNVSLATTATESAVSEIKRVQQAIEELTVQSESSLADFIIHLRTDFTSFGKILDEVTEGSEATAADVKKALDTLEDISNVNANFIFIDDEQKTALADQAQARKDIIKLLGEQQRGQAIVNDEVSTGAKISNFLSGDTKKLARITEALAEARRVLAQTTSTIAAKEKEFAKTIEVIKKLYPEQIELIDDLIEKRKELSTSETLLDPKGALKFEETIDNIRILAAKAEFPIEALEAKIKEFDRTLGGLKDALDYEATLKKIVGTAEDAGKKVKKLAEPKGPFALLNEHLGKMKTLLEDSVTAATLPDPRSDILLFSEKELAELAEVYVTLANKVQVVTDKFNALTKGTEDVGVSLFDQQIGDIDKIVANQIEAIELAQATRITNFRGTEEELTIILDEFEKERTRIVLQGELDRARIRLQTLKELDKFESDIDGEPLLDIAEIEETNAEIAELIRLLAELGIVIDDTSDKSFFPEGFLEDFNKLFNAAAQLIAEISNFALQKIEEETKAELDALDDRYDARVEAAEGDKDLQKDLVEEKEQEEERIQKRAFERKKRLDFLNATTALASAIVNALGSAFPPLNFILAGIVAAAGAVQLTRIKAQKFASGGFTGSGMFGQNADETGRKPVGVVHEHEYVAPTDQISKYPALFRALEQDRLGRMAKFATGGFTSNIPQLINPSATNVSGPVSLNESQFALLVDTIGDKVLQGSRAGAALGAVDRKKELERELEFQTITQV